MATFVSGALDRMSRAIVAGEWASASALANEVLEHLRHGGERPPYARLMLIEAAQRAGNAGRRRLAGTITDIRAIYEDEDEDEDF